MMIQNAVFMAEPLPLPAGTGGGAAPAAGASGIFQQLLQGMQPAGAQQGTATPAGEQAADTAITLTAMAPVELAQQGAAEAGVAVPAIAPEGLAAETGETAVLPAPARDAAKPAGTRLQLVMTWQALKEDAARAALAPVEPKPVSAEAAKVMEKTAQVLVAEAEPAAEVAAATGETAAQPPAVDAMQQIVAAAQAAAAQAAPVQDRGLATAAAKVEANMERRTDRAPAEAGARALAQLTSLEKMGENETELLATGEEAGQAAPVVTERQKSAPEPGQKAETVTTIPNRAGQAATLTGATERAQVEVPAAPEGTKAARPEMKQAQGFTPTTLGGGSFQAAATVAKDAPAAATSGVPAAVANGVPAAIVAQDVPAMTEVRYNEPVQAPAAAEAQAEATAVTADNGAVSKEKGQVKQATEHAGQQPAQAEPAAEETVQAAEKGQERREARHAESRQAAPARETEPAQMPATASVSTEVSENLAPAVTAQTEKGAGREGSGFHGEQGHQEKKGQEQQNAQLSGVTFEAKADATSETIQPQAKETTPRSALHENILSQVREGVVTHDGKGNGQMTVRLNPGELGELKIQVRMEDSRFVVEVQADNRMVKDLLLSNLDSLKEALTGKNLTMDSFNVSTGGGGFNAPSNEERGNQRQQSFHRFAQGGYGGQEERQVNYLTAEVNTLLDVRF